MKHNLTFSIILVFLATSLFSQSNIQQTLSVNSSGAAADASAQLDVSATDKGMLVPRMTSAQRTAIASPATGLLVYDTTTGGFWFYNGTTWANLSAPKTLQDTDGNTKIQVEESANEDVIRFDLGGSENLVLRKNANGVPRLEFSNSLLNTFVGLEAGFSGSAGGFNTGVGRYALRSNTNGENNTAVGVNALYANTEGLYNTATGITSLASNTTGSNNTATGAYSLYLNNSGFENTASGYAALYSNTEGIWNTATGNAALYANTTGDLNTATGYQALHDNITGNGNTAFGYNALLNNTTSNNTAVGTTALISNTTGQDNTGVGYLALGYNKTGNNNTAVGSHAFRSNGLNGSSNCTAVGSYALYSGNNNGIINGNTAVGYKALTDVRAGGASNTAVGEYALTNNETGAVNCAFGALALWSNIGGNFNIGIGNAADVLSGNLSKASAIGYGAKVGCSNCMVLGGTGSDAVKVGIGVSSPSTANLVISGSSGANGIDLSTANLYADMRVIRNTLNTTDKDLYLGYGSPSGSATHLYSDGIETLVVKDQRVGIGVSSVPTGVLLHVEGNAELSSGSSFYVGGQTNNGVAGVRLHHIANNTYIDHKGSGDLHFRADNVLGATTRMTIKSNGNIGIGRNPLTNILEVEGNASKFSAGDWLANSDARLKKNISPLNSQEMLDKLLALQGVTYEWNDDKTGSKRPEGIQYGFTAQNIREVFPTLVEEDKLGFLQTAYGTYDAMTVEAIRALNDKIEAQQAEIDMLKNVQSENANLKSQLDDLSRELGKITAALAGMGVELK